MSEPRDRAELVQRIRIALERTLLTAVKLGGAQEREVRRLMESPTATGVQTLPESAEYEHYLKELTSLLRLALPSGAPAPAPHQQEK